MIENELKDTRDIYVCVYDENEIGLFKKISYNTKPFKSVMGYKFKSGNIYVGIDTDHIGISKTHEDEFNYDKWEPIGTYVKCNKNKYISDCEIEKAINLDTIRLYMYSNEKLKDYIPGKATSKELIDVLIYSYEYLNMDINKVKFKNRAY